MPSVNTYNYPTDVALSREESRSFQIANLWASILIIAIHYNTKHYISTQTTANSNYLMQEFITNGVARIAVPFFALSSGIFFFMGYRSFSSYGKSIKKRMGSILFPYLIASSLFYVVYLLNIHFHNQFYSITPHAIFRNVFLKPPSVQFWFLRDLLVLSFCAPLIFVLVKCLRQYFVLALCFLWILNIEILPPIADENIVKIETLFYYVLGCYLIQNIALFKKALVIINRFRIPLIAISLALFLLRLFSAPVFYNSSPHNPLLAMILHKTAIATGIGCLLALSQNIRNARIVYLSSYTFFVFLYHAYPLNNIIVKLSDYVLSDEYKFYLTFPAATMVSFWLAIICEKCFKRIYYILAGARGSAKVMARY